MPDRVEVGQSDGDQDEETAQGAFRRMDRDNDGFLSWHEWSQVVDKSDPEKLCILSPTFIDKVCPNE